MSCKQCSVKHLDFKMRIILTIFLVSSLLVSRGQNSLSLTSKADTINYLINLIQKDGLVSSPGTDFAGAPSKQYCRFVFLLSMTDNNQLLDLLNNSKGCLRIYAFMGLYHNKYDLLYKTKEILKSDSTEVSSVSGCLYGTTTIAKAVDEIEQWYWKFQTDQLLSLISSNKEFRNSQFNWVADSKN